MTLERNFPGSRKAVYSVRACRCRIRPNTPRHRRDMADLSKTQRIGALVPATNPVVEPDFYRVVPPEITVHFERMWNGNWGTQPEATTDTGHRLSMSSGEANEVDWALFGFDVNKMNDDVARGASALSNIGPDVLVYACTSGTWHKGYMAFDRHMADVMEEASGITSVTAVTLVHRSDAAHGQQEAEHRRALPQLPPAQPAQATDGGGRVRGAQRRRGAVDAGLDEPPRDRRGVAADDSRLRGVGGAGRGGHGVPAGHGLAGAGRSGAAGAEAGQDGDNGQPGQHLDGAAAGRLDEAHTRIRQPAAQPGIGVSFLPKEITRAIDRQRWCAYARVLTPSPPVAGRVATADKVNGYVDQVHRRGHLHFGGCRLREPRIFFPEFPCQFSWH